MMYTGRVRKLLIRLYKCWPRCTFFDDLLDTGPAHIEELYNFFGLYLNRYSTASLSNKNIILHVFCGICFLEG